MSKKQTVRAQKQAARRRAPRVAPPVADSSSPDSKLLIGGLALVILVLGDTVFLALSTRFLRGA